MKEALQFTLFTIFTAFMLLWGGSLMAAPFFLPATWAIVLLCTFPLFIFVSSYTQNKSK